MESWMVLYDLVRCYFHRINTLRDKKINFMGRLMSYCRHVGENSEAFFPSVENQRNNVIF